MRAALMARVRCAGWPGLVAAVLIMVLAGCGRTPTYSQPEPGFARHSADEVVQALQAAGLSIEQVRPRSVATATPNPELRRPPRIAGGPPTEPMVEIEARTFAIPASGMKEGRLFIFDSSQRLRAKRIWFARFPDLYPYVYVHENVLLWLDGSLAAEEAERFRAALDSLPSGVPAPRTG